MGYLFLILPLVGVVLVGVLFTLPIFFPPIRRAVQRESIRRWTVSLLAASSFLTIYLLYTVLLMEAAVAFYQTQNEPLLAGADDLARLRRREAQFERIKAELWFRQMMPIALQHCFSSIEVCTEAQAFIHHYKYAGDTIPYWGEPMASLVGTWVTLIFAGLASGVTIVRIDQQTKKGATHPAAPLGF